VGRGQIHTQPMRKIKPPLPDLPRPDASDPELAEERMRRALGLASNRNGQGAQPRPEQQSKPLARPTGRAPGDRPRQRFVQDGDVPVTLVGRHRPHETDLTAVSESRNAIEAALQDERAARARGEQALQDALATVRDLQTKLGHAELAHREKSEAAQAARGAAEALQAEHREREVRWHEDLAAERAARVVAEAALHEAACARGRADQTLQAAPAASPVSHPRDVPAKPTAKASVKRQVEKAREAAAAPRQREPQPVKWWLKTAKP